MPGYRSVSYDPIPCAVLSERGVVAAFSAIHLTQSWDCVERHVNLLCDGIR